ncbi:hypothetical protein [Acetobacter sp. DsW_059]|uniref:hypothetical protein n=1 Tax=Acetobacter sp. DsW_059 TaxID=1670661 RepID=UPI000A3CEFD5|nr:hypothetical protein [Acetobacter sp. DsW_059]OUJ09173.1 hypothetical protein HK25_12080 [Acetobacter sp. DsW_059]
MINTASDKDIPLDDDMPFDGGISLDEAEQGQTGEENDHNSQKDSLYQGASSEQVELFGRQKFFELRESWSSIIIIWIFILILFNISLTFLIGWGGLNFKSYKWFINSITLETFLQIVGLGYIAVKYLFSDGKTKS